jgi:hypothetical protein
MPELIPGGFMIWFREAQECCHIFAPPGILLGLESFQLSLRHETQVMELVERGKTADSKMVGEVDDIIQLNVVAPGFGSGERPHRAAIAHDLHTIAKHLGVPAAGSTFAHGSDELPHAVFRHEEIGGEGIRSDLAEAVAICHPADRPTPLPVKGGVPQDNHMASINMDRENNERNRVFSKEEFDRLLAVTPAHLEPILLTAFHTGMRRGELLKLTWDRVDLKAGMIRLRPESTKTQEGRIIPLTKELTQMLQEFTIYTTKDGQRLPQLFTYGGKPISSIRRAFETACQRAGWLG